MEHHEAVNIVRLGPRIPRAVGIMDNVLDIAVPSRLMERTPPSGGGSGSGSGSGDSSSGSSTSDSTSSTTSSASSATSSCGANDCEKPTSSSTFTMPVILGVVIPVVGAAILFFILHRRHVRKQREEDANDRHASMDFGLGDVPQPGHAHRKAKAAMTELDNGGEKGLHMSRRQRSMELNMDSPYLLPPEVQNSSESLHSLSRTLQHQHEDPYRPVTQYFPGDEKSVRSQSKQGSSIYTGSSAAPSRFQDLSTAELIPNAGAMPRSTPPKGFVPPPRQNSLPQSNASIMTSDSQPPLPPYPSEPPKAHLPEHPQPEEIKRKGLPTTPRLGQNLAPASPPHGDDRESFVSNGENAMRQSNNYLGALINDSDRPPTPPSKSPETTRKPPPPAIKSLPSNPRPRKESMQSNGSNQYGDGFKVTPPSPDRGNNKEMMRGQRYSMDVPPEEFVQAGLGAPGFDAKRLSMGFRPLPPDAVTEMDDPEIRANRIRSFYKEYFDDSKPDPSGGQYYEDYDENYMGDAAYFDPETNAFVMPGTQPVHRRAMTPPPRGRFAGPPRTMHGSMGAMSATGPRGAPGPRAYSSASGRMGPPKMRRPLPPPSALNTLPTPSKLKDDSFALFNSLEFAPPQNYRDRAAGRSESPFGERRPYSPMVPAFTPVVSAFDELAPMPSPHLLRKSGTFTALDFAPPRKIRDVDNMSDAGSIRSNRSGISQAQLGAIRGGAYRVSRIPQDVVFTKDDLATTLKPQWGMRPGS